VHKLEHIHRKRKRHKPKLHNRKPHRGPMPKQHRSSSKQVRVHKLELEPACRQLEARTW
jgi:hypothetical protein